MSVTRMPFFQRSVLTVRMIHEAKYVGVSALELPKDGNPGTLELDYAATKYTDMDKSVEVESTDWQESVRAVTSVYSDGGVFRPRRCEVGSWAWVGADQAGRRRVYQYGWMEAHGVLREGVTNNLSEFAAMLRALEAMPTGWCGRVCSDSEVTIGRFCDGWRMSGIPTSWMRRMYAALERLGDLEYVLMKGHPTQAEVAAGEGVRARSGKRYPVSEHQVLCDTLCTRTLEEWSRVSGVTR